jgi:hypothetical protein
MSGYLFPLMVSLSNHGRDHVRVHPGRSVSWTPDATSSTITCEKGSMGANSPLGLVDIVLSVGYSALVLGFLVWSYVLLARARTRK